MSLNTLQTDFRPGWTDYAEAPGKAPQRLRLSSSELLRGARELIIQHGDNEYRLRLTQNDKLILTK
jgi:hemin uptake protein HemP